jgi:hypothetical protein
MVSGVHVRIEATAARRENDKSKRSGSSSWRWRLSPNAPMPARRSATVSSTPSNSRSASDGLHAAKRSRTCGLPAHGLPRMSIDSSMGDESKSRAMLLTSAISLEAKLQTCSCGKRKPSTVRRPQLRKTSHCTPAQRLMAAGKSRNSFALRPTLLKSITRTAPAEAKGEINVAIDVTHSLASYASRSRTGSRAPPAAKRLGTYFT